MSLRLLVPFVRIVGVRFALHYEDAITHSPVLNQVYMNDTGRILACGHEICFGQSTTPRSLVIS
jgi:hypothetical protein